MAVSTVSGIQGERDAAELAQQVPHQMPLAAYNAGPAPARGCGCVPYAETRAYVARILAFMNGVGDPLVGGDGTGLKVRLIE